MPVKNLTPRPDALSVAGRDIARSLDPVWLMRDAGLEPDDWQAEVLQSDARRQLLLCSRQSGKSTVAGCLALHTALYQPGALVLLMSPTLDQSKELFRKLLDLFRTLDGLPSPSAESALRLELPNGSRVACLSGSETSIRGYSNPALIVIDEAAFCTDEFIEVVLPMMLRGQSRLLILSTPNGRQGWFYEQWTGSEEFEKTTVSWRDSPQISEEQAQFYRRVAGDLKFRQELECEFLDLEEAVFPSEIIDAAFTDTFEAWAI